MTEDASLEKILQHYTWHDIYDDPINWNLLQRHTEERILEILNNKAKYTQEQVQAAKDRHNGNNTKPNKSKQLNYWTYVEYKDLLRQPYQQSRADFVKNWGRIRRRRESYDQKELKDTMDTGKLCD